MTFKRKLGIAAVLVVALVALVIVFTKSEPGSLLDVAFVRKQGTFILISNPNPFEVSCTLLPKQGGWVAFPTVPRRGSVVVAMPDGLSGSWIGGRCERTPQKTQEWLWRLQDLLRMPPTRRLADWEIAVGIPAPKTPLP